MKDLLGLCRTKFRKVWLQYEKSEYLDKLDSIVNKYNNKYHDLDVENNGKYPKSNVGDHVRISKLIQKIRLTSKIFQWKKYGVYVAYCVIKFKGSLSTKCIALLIELYTPRSTLVDLNLDEVSQGLYHYPFIISLDH